MELWGQEGQEILSGLRIGLVGCGGVGSMLATHLPRLGIGGLVLVDFDRLKPANANRADGATDEDIEARRLKTDVAKREAKKAATAPNFEVTLVDGSVVEEDPVYAAVPDLLDCDIILCAVDAARPRKVLDHLASAHCIPVINGGSRLHVDTDGGLAPAAKIETSITGPGFPCFRCQRVWTSEDVEYERDDPRFRGDRTYVDGGVNPDQQPRSASVIGINSIVAGIIQQRLQGLALAISTRVVGIHRLNPGDLSAEWMGMELLFSCPDDCGRAPIAAGDGHRLPLGTDWAMRYERDDIPDPDTVTITPNEAEDLLSSDPE